jgi:predicted acylesterase/phospholipase RssA
MSNALYFRRVVFAGGGCRCVWQAGFWQVAAAPLGLERAVIGSVSAGAAMACLVRADRIDEGMAVFADRFRHNRRNMYLTRWGSGQPVFPQYAIYRQGLDAVIDAAALQRLHRSPDIRVLMAVPPPALSPRAATVLGMLTYLLEKRLKRPMHPTWPPKLGFQALTAGVHDCRNTDELADLVLQSSCTPPFVPIMRRNGQPVLDGGLIDNVPVSTVADVDGSMLVLLSRRYPPDRLPTGGDRLYLQPSQPPPIDRWDYTNADGLQQTFDLGRRDGKAFLDRFSGIGRQ